MVTISGTHIFSTAPMIVPFCAARRSLGHDHPLHLEEVGTPVAEADGQPQAEDHAEPVDAHRVGVERAQVAPQAGEIGVAAPSGWMTCTFCWIVAIILVQPPGVDQAEDRNQAASRTRSGRTGAPR